MSSATKTIKLRLEYRPGLSECFAATKALFNRVASFYFEVIQAHPGVLELSSQAALTKLEQLTHVTKTNVNPLMPLLEIAPGVPAMFRRAAIHAALGAAHSFFSNLDKWRKEKEKFEAKAQTTTKSQPQAKGPRKKKGQGQNQTQAVAVAKIRKFTKRPPVPPRSWNRSVIFYAGQYKELTSNSVMLRLWDGTNWCWLKFGLSGRAIPAGQGAEEGAGWQAGSPHLVKHGRQAWSLHLPLVKQFTSPGKVENQVRENPLLKVCAVDLNIKEHLAVCTVQTVEGTVTATRFIGGGKQLHGFRKRLLGKVAVNRSKTGLIAERDNQHLWQKIRHLNENVAHQISHRIVEFARQHGASVIVFKHLGNFSVEKGRYSRKANEKRSYWLRGRILHYTRYKAWAVGEGLITSRVSPYNTSRECASCHANIARYGEGEAPEGYRAGAPLVYCPNCGMRASADRNASIVIGQRFFTRYKNQGTNKEKPQAAP